MAHRVDDGNLPNAASQVVARLVELTEAQAYLDLFRAAPADLEFRTHEFDAATLLVAPRIDVPLFNRAIGLGVTAPPTEAAIQAITFIFRNAGVRNFAIQLSPPVVTDAVHEWLLAESLDVRDHWSKVFRARDPECALDTALRIEHIGPEFAAAFARVACEGFKMPPFLIPWLEASVGRPDWHHYLAWDGLTPVATAAMYVRDAVAWLGVATTLEEARNRGAQSALLARRIQDGTALGCEWFVTETGKERPDHPNASYHNMLRAGFALAYHRPNYMDTRTVR